MRSDLKLMTQTARRLNNAPGREKDTHASHGWSYSAHTDSPRRAPMQGMRDILTRSQANDPSEASPARRGRSNAAAACPVADVWSSTPIANITTMSRRPTQRTTRLYSIPSLFHDHEHLGSELLTILRHLPGAQMRQTGRTARRQICPAPLSKTSASSSPA